MTRSETKTLRLYRGLSKPYKPEDVAKRFEEMPQGTNFTDCPYTALRYATGRRGVLLVVDVPRDQQRRVFEALWLGNHAKRLEIWGRFDELLVANIPAKELRAEVRQKGMSKLSDQDKGVHLEWVIKRRLGDEARRESLAKWTARQASEPVKGPAQESGCCG